MAKSRNFCFTSFNIDFKYELKEDMTYLAYGTETCPTTKRPHHQGYVCFKVQRSCGPRALSKICNLVGGKGHVEPMGGSLDQNDAYCSKESALTTLGKKPKQGQRVDLEAAAEAVKNGRSVVELAVENPAMYHQYGRTLNFLEDVALRRRFRTEMTEGRWIWGSTGTGKSHECFEGFDPDTHFVKNLEDQWWDGYTGQETVIFNDFRGQVTYSELLTLVDKWPHTVKRRNREPAPFLAKLLIVTSSKAPEDVYHNVVRTDSLDQLRRRFTITEFAQKCSGGNTGTPEQNDLAADFEAKYESYEGD